MSFGRVFASLFFLIAAPLGAVVARGLPVALGVGAVLVAVGAFWLMVRGDRWARPGGIALAAAMTAAGVLRFAEGGALALLLAMGGLATVVLLAVSGRVTERPRHAWVGWSGVGVGAGLVVVAAALPATAIGSGSAGADMAAAALPAAEGVPDRLVWTDFGTGLERAKAEGKPLLVHFFASWCGYCKKMDRDTWDDPGVIARSQDVVAVRVNVDAQHQVNGFSGAALASRYRVAGTPAQLLLDAQGAVLANASGYQDPRQLLGWLDGGLRGLRGRVGPPPTTQIGTTSGRP